MSLPQHAAFKVEKKHDVNGDTISPEMSKRYGPTKKRPMLRLRDAMILFADDRLFEFHQKKLERARPVDTLMKAITFKVPLGDVLIKDGKQTYVKNSEMFGPTELIQIDGKLLTSENMRAPQQIIKAEANWVTRNVGNREFVTRMLEGNDQMTIKVPRVGMNQLKDIQALLFNETELKQGELVQNWLNGFGNLKMKIWYQAKEVSGGLVTVGDGPDTSYLSRKYVFIPHTLTDVCSHGILV